MKRIAVTVAVAALVVTASALSGLIPSAGLLNGVWADDEAKGTREQRDEKVLLDQVPPPVKATIERESAGGQVTGVSQATERGEAAYAVDLEKIKVDGETVQIASSRYPAALVDTGTSMFVLSKAASMHRQPTDTRGESKSYDTPARLFSQRRIICLRAVPQR